MRKAILALVLIGCHQPAAPPDAAQPLRVGDSVGLPPFRVLSGTVLQPLAFKLKLPSGCSTAAGIIDCSSATGASFPLLGGDGTSSAVTYGLGAADEGMYSGGARSVILQESLGGYSLEVSLANQVRATGGMTVTGSLGVNGSTPPASGITTVGTVTADSFVGTHSENHFDAYDPADNSTSNKLQAWVVTYASTLADGAFTGAVVGVGGGNYVVKLCSDAATCSGANLKATCTISCTATVGTLTACTINNAAISAASTLTLQPSTACATTAETGNFTFHVTTP